MLNQTAKTCKKQSRELVVAVIYKFKTNGKLNGTRCTLVRNSEGGEHKVWTHANGCASSCDCTGFEKSHGRRKCYHLKFIEALETSRQAELLTAVNAELAKVNATPATAEELVATQARVLLPNSVDQLAYFIQQNRRSDECHERCSPVPTPIVRKVSQDCLLNGHRGGAFSGRAAKEVA